MKRRATLALLAALAAGAGPAKTACVISKFAEFPVTISGMRALVAARINGVDQKFVIDNGAFYSMLSAAHAAQLHLRPTSLPRGFFVQGVGDAQNVSLAKVKSSTLAGYEIPNVEFLVGITDPGDRAGARVDLDAADKALAEQSDLRLKLAGLFMELDAQPAAIRQFDLWLAARPDDNRRAVALNGRCWARATQGQELDRALADCQAALRLARGNAGVLDSRGLVRLRLGQFDAAIADYDQALEDNPKSAWSLYGRGLAKQRKGLTAEGKANIAAAVAIDPALPEKARTYGLAT